MVCINSKKNTAHTTFFHYKAIPSYMKVFETKMHHFPSCGKCALPLNKLSFQWTYGQQDITTYSINMLTNDTKLPQLTDLG